MASQLRASIHLLVILEGKEGKVFQFNMKSSQRESVKLEVRISLLGDFASGKSSLVRSHADAYSLEYSTVESSMMAKVLLGSMFSTINMRFCQELLQVRPIRS